MPSPQTNRPPKIHCGLVGCGFICNSHLIALNRLSDVKVAALCDVDKDRADWTATKWGIQRTYESLNAMLAEENLDVVHVLTPPPQHWDATLECFKNRSAIFLEKPMSLNGDHSRSIAQQSALLGIRVGVNHNYVFYPAYQRLRGIVNDGYLGSLRHLTIHHSAPLRPLAAKAFDAWMFQSWQNVIYEYFPHPLSMVQRMLGDVLDADCRPVRQRLVGEASFFATWLVNMVCQRGTCQINVEFDTSLSEFHVHAVGQDGTAIADMHRNTVQLVTKSQYEPPLATFVESCKTSWSLAKQSVRNLGDFATSFAQRSPLDGFSLSFSESIRHFYTSSDEENRADLLNAVRIVQSCDLLVKSATRYIN